MNITKRTVVCNDDNIDSLRSRYPDGLHFVVGDTHGQAKTLAALMEKIKFNPQKDHVYFVGDYNAGGDVRVLLAYMAAYFQPDYTRPGFHMIRGNHERELSPTFTLENLPDIIVLRRQHMTYYIVHAGMVDLAFDAINEDLANNPQQPLFVYKLDDICVGYDAPLRQLIWSRNGLYSQRSPWHVWPSEAKLQQQKACIIHGHSPYCFFKFPDHYSYGGDDRTLFWQKQHIYFSEALQSFNIDANVKGRYANGEDHSALACVCLECIEEIAAQNGGHLALDAVKQAPNFVFSMDFVYDAPIPAKASISKITDTDPAAKLITMDADWRPWILSDREPQ